MKEERVKISEGRTLARERGHQSESMRRRVDSTVKKAGFKEMREGKQEEPPREK